MKKKHYLQEIIRTAILRSTGTTHYFYGGNKYIILPLGKGDFLNDSHSFRGKVIVFGLPPENIVETLGIKKNYTLPSISKADSCIPAEGEVSFSKSAGFIAHHPHTLTKKIAPHLFRRPFTRFDYSNEWNNLGFGRIRTDGSIWSAFSGFEVINAQEVSSIYLNQKLNNSYCGAYITVCDSEHASILWCARPVGPIDSTEWTIIENFLSDYRFEDLPSLPCIRQTPLGCDCLVTMRLDCDEAISSAYKLFSSYKKKKVPLSLAIKTSLEISSEDSSLLKHVCESNGSIMSHTHRHQLNWGPSYKEAFIDAEKSMQWFYDKFSDLPFSKLAVSPFHTNPPYAITALIDAGFIGFISGIIHNDPEFLLGRAGIPPFSEDKIISISQQSMLHGDSYRRQGKSVNSHIKAFQAQYYSNGIFGYLDHPFSERYQYDWENENERIEAHMKLISAIKEYDNVWFWNQAQCFEFVKDLSMVRFKIGLDGPILDYNWKNKNSIVYRFKNSEFIIHSKDPK